METKKEKTRMIAIGAGIFLVLALIFTGILYFQNKKLNQSVQQEQSNAATLLSQKHALQKEIEKFNAEIAGLKGKNKELDGILTGMTSKLNRAQTELNRLSIENRDKKAIQQKLQEVQTLKDELSAQVMALTENLDNLTQENITLNNTILNLQSENHELAANMQMMQAVMANNFLIEALKGKMERPTVAARRTNKIKVDFDIPVAIQSQVHFKIKKPNGNVVDSQTDKNITMTTLGPSTELLASSSSVFSAPIKTKRISMIYKPGVKLRPGIYTIEVYNNETYLGASQIKLK